jgi:hypothetical protein
VAAQAKRYEPPISKEAVNRAGRLIASVLVVFREGDHEKLAHLEEVQSNEINAAFEVIDWWRGLHAKPLTSVSANLRHYLKPHGPILVTQRLKRLPTVVDKLLREPKMKLSQMADIGGCRALLPDQSSVYAVEKSLRKNWDVGASAITRLNQRPRAITLCMRSCFAKGISSRCSCGHQHRMRGQTRWRRTPGALDAILREEQVRQRCMSTMWWSRNSLLSGKEALSPMKL